MQTAVKLPSESTSESQARAFDIVPACDFLAFVILITIACFYFTGTVWVENHNGDQSRYLGLASSIAETGSYEFNYRPHTRFPPGVSLTLAAAMKAGFADFKFLMGINLLMVLGFFSASYILLRSLGAPILGIVFLHLAAISPEIFIRASRFISSDFFYCFSSLTAVFLALRIEQGKSGFFSWITFTAVLIYAVLVRSTGVSLVFAALAYTFLKSNGRFKMIFSSVLATAVMGMWWTWKSLNMTTLFEGEFMNSYLKQLFLADAKNPLAGEVSLLGFVQRVGINTISKLTDYSEIMLHLGWTEPVWFSPLVVIPCILLILGICNHRMLFLKLYTLGYCFLIVSWPFDEGHRYVFPVLPILTFYVVHGVKYLNPNWLAALFVGVLASLSKSGQGLQEMAFVVFWPLLAALLWFKIRARYLVGVPIVVAYFLGVYGLYGDYTDNKNRVDRVFSKAFVVEAAENLKPKVKVGESVISAEDGVMHQVGGFRTIEYSATMSPAQIVEVSERLNARYLVVFDDTIYPYFFPTQKERLEQVRLEYPELLEKVDSGDYWTAFKIISKPQRESKNG